MRYTLFFCGQLTLHPDYGSYAEGDVIMEIGYRDHGKNYVQCI